MRRRAARRGFVLYVMLITVTIGSLMAVSVVYAAQAQRSAANAAARRVQSRAIAWSGLQAAMSELSRQRTELLRGAEPTLPEDWTLFTESDGRRAVARIVVPEGGTLVTSEAGKLDVNTAAEGMLALMPGLDAETAKRLIAVREGRKFLSVHELGGVEGLRQAFAGSAEESVDVSASTDAFVPPEAVVSARPLQELLTVFSFDPNVQAGLGRNAESHTGKRRIALGGKWSERLGRAITERFDPNAATLVKSLMEQGTKFERESDVVRVLRRFNVPPADWAEVLDAFCGDSSPYLLGRVDVGHADAEVLACVPGIDKAAAEQVVLLRAKLPAEQRQSLVWLVQENILTADQFEQAVDHLTTRTLQWRIVIEGGFEEGEDEDGDAAAALTDRVVLEAVIDVASERPRIAYLRDITMAGAARALGPLRRDGSRETREEPEESAVPETSPVVSSQPSSDRPPEPPSPVAGADALPDGDGEDVAGAEEDPRLGRWTTGRQ